MPRHVLHPVLSWTIIVFGALAAMQWLLILPLAVRADVIPDLNCWVGALRSAAASCSAASHVLADNYAPDHIKPFSRDFFFIEWNVLPLLLCGTHIALTYYFGTCRETLKRRFRGSDGAPLGDAKAPIRDNLFLVFALLIVLNIIAVNAQFHKQAAFIAKSDYLYWWDIRISPAIFWVRLVFLAPVISLVALVLWEAFWGLFTLFRIMRRRAVTPFVLDPHRRFGMEPYGVFTMLLITPWFLALVTSLLEWADHRGAQGGANTAGTMLLGVFGIIGLLLIIDPIIRLHGQLERARETLLAKMETETEALEQYLTRISVGEVVEDPVMTRASPAFVVHQHVISSSPWPFPKWFGPPTFLSLISPFLGAFGISLNAIADLFVSYIF